MKALIRLSDHEIEMIMRKYFNVDSTHDFTFTYYDNEMSIIIEYNKFFKKKNDNK